MELSKEKKRKKDRTSNNDERRREKKSKKARSRSRSPEEYRKRRRSESKSPTPLRYYGNPADKEKQEVKSEPPVRKAKETDMLNTRTGGAYIPPARLRMMQAQITDKSSIAYQRLAWEALKKSIHGHINKINVGNIGIIIKQLLKENIVRGRGLLCRSVIQAQAASPTFTNVYAALVAAVNSRFPNIGELLLKRLVIQFKRGFKRNDKSICISAASFIAHLVNQRVAHEILALELLTLLVETPSDDSVEVAIAFLKECGQKLTEVSSKGVNAIFEMLRNILHEGQLDKRVQYMIEVMFQVWKDGFKDHPALLEELELVPEEEQFTHLLMLDDATDPQDILNVFKHDDKYEENEQKYKTLSNEILGSDAESEDGSGGSGSEESDDEEDEEESQQKEMTIIDNTETNLVALRRTIYLTINSSLDFEECAHKLMKMQLKPGQEVELCHMFLDCCAEQRTYEKFYGLLAQRFCNLNRIFIGPFEEIFKDSYGTAHRLDTNRLRNVSKFFAHLLFTDSISWEVLECVRLNEEDTTSSSRIYIKILFQELAEYMGLKKLNDRLKDPTLQGAFLGVFPRDNPKNTRFSINFFTSIGLGGLTDELREHLKQMPKNVPPPPDINIESGSSSDSSSSSSSSESSDSSSEEEDSNKKKKDGKKSKKDKKTKEKTPKTPDEPDKSKDKERWGHDGFYDNYGKDARRYEPERDKDNFVIPQMPRRNDRSDDRRRDDRSYQDRNRRSDDEPRSRSKKDEDRGGGRDRDSREDRDGQRDRKSGRDDERRDRDDGSRDRDRNSEGQGKEVDRSDREEINDKTRDRRNDREGRDRESREDREVQRDRRSVIDDERRDRDNGRRDRDRNSERQGKEVNKSDRDEIIDKTRGRRNDREGRDGRDKERIRDERQDRNISNNEREHKETRDRNEKQRAERTNGRDKERRDKENRDESRDVRRDQNFIESRDEIRERNGKVDRRDRNDDREKDTRRSKKDRYDDPRKLKEEDRKKKDESKSKMSSKPEVKDETDSDSSDSDSSSSSDSDSSDDSSKKDDGWDIRGSSVRKEVVERYWDMPVRKRETVERSPERSGKRRDR